MDATTQHKRNAAKEKRWMDDAARDSHNMILSGKKAWAEGNRVEARFDFAEANNATSWVPKRKRILKNEIIHIRK
jgi:hypothetical protein